MTGALWKTKPMISGTTTSTKKVNSTQAHHLITSNRHQFLSMLRWVQVNS